MFISKVTALLPAFIAWGFEFFVVDILVARGYGFPLKFFKFFWLLFFFLISFVKSKGIPRTWRKGMKGARRSIVQHFCSSPKSFRYVLTSFRNLWTEQFVGNFYGFFFYISLYNLLEKDVLSVLFVIMTSKMMHIITYTSMLRFQIELAAHWWFHLLVLSILVA